jgi:hypothetical protein
MAQMINGLYAAMKQAEWKQRNRLSFAFLNRAQQAV